MWFGGMLGVWWFDEGGWDDGVLNLAVGFAAWWDGLRVDGMCVG